MKFFPFAPEAEEYSSNLLIHTLQTAARLSGAEQEVLSTKEWADTHCSWRAPLSARQRKPSALAGFGKCAFPGRCPLGFGRRSIPLTLQQQQPGVGLQQLLPVGCLHCLLLRSESRGRLRNGRNASVFPGKLTSVPIHWCQTLCWKPEVAFRH